MDMDMDSDSLSLANATCPFCHLTLPPSLLQRHANSHFEEEEQANYQIYNSLEHDIDEQLAKDLEMAQQLSLSSHSTTTSTSQQASMEEDKVSCLIALQTKSSFYQVNNDTGNAGGLMAMLCKCLKSDYDHSASTTATTTTLLSGYVDHYQSLPSQDAGWGCGWRNIQMLASHLLSLRPDARNILFGGSAFVPDIPYLQRWLEIAWERGFDVLGSHHFSHSVYGSQHRIGTTECAALFRSFGLRARIVDFGPEEMQSLFLSVPGTTVVPTNSNGKRKAFQIYGPMDRYLTGRELNMSQSRSIRYDKSQRSTINSACTSVETTGNKFPRKNGGPHPLLDWVWSYFADEGITTSASHQRVIVTNKALSDYVFLPLFFQYDGHSRTIVGIQVKNQMKGMPQYNLLILDPGHRTAALKKSLEENVGWKKLLMRGPHTLEKPQYQLCYIDPGLASGEEMEQLKTIDSVFIEI